MFREATLRERCALDLGCALGPELKPLATQGRGFPLGGPSGPSLSDWLSGGVGSSSVAGNTPRGSEGGKPIGVLSVGVCIEIVSKGV